MIKDHLSRVRGDERAAGWVGHSSGLTPSVVSLGVNSDKKKTRVDKFKALSTVVGIDEDNNKY